MWERSEVLYVFIKERYPATLHPLMDFREWLMVLYKRVQSHMNLKLRRYVIKSTLKRTYMTTFMSEYVFDEFLKALNKGLIFKDSNIYTQFSLKNDLVNRFYERYFVSECSDLSADLSRFFNAFLRHVSHPQLMLCTMRNLAKDYPSLRKEAPLRGFLGNTELEALLQSTHTFFGE